MRLEEIYPSKYASGSDLAGKPVTLTIEKVVMEIMHPGPGSPAVKKPVLYFHKTTKGIILSRPLWIQIIAILHDDDTTAWPGQQITIYPEPMLVASIQRIAIRARKPT